MIILIILKWIGIVLLSILGLILGLLLLILFVPFRYGVSVSHPKMGDKISYGFRVSWALRFISLRKKENEDRIVLRILGIPIKKINDESEEHEGDIFEEETKDEKKEEKEKEKSIKKEEKAIKKEEKEANREERIRIKEQKREEKRRKKSGYVEKPVREPTAFEKLIQKIKDKISEIRNKIFDILKKIRLVFRKISAIIEFVRDTTTKKVMKKLTKEIVRLIKYVFPKKIKANLVFGTGDPAATGYILAGVSMCPAVYKKNVIVRPDFEEKVIIGNASAYGRIRVIYFVRLAIRVLRDKEMRATYKKIKNFNQEGK